MKVLSIETSCDETAVSVLECTGDANEARFRVLGNALLSQIAIHAEYGGVFPTLAKREHAKNIVPLLGAALAEAELLVERADASIEPDIPDAYFTHEPDLPEALRAFVKAYETPAIDAIAVTHGPGLAPALWVGVNVARALARAWDIPLVGANHLEGHLLSAMLVREGEGLVMKDVNLPALGLVISGGHTEIVAMEEWLSYRKIGETRDDAVGEAYDKVARMMGLPYPGGPEVSKLAEANRVDKKDKGGFSLPRPMLHDDTCDFSFSGLKTAVLYLVKARPEISASEKQALAHEFEDAVADVLFKKAARAIESTDAKLLALGGGVSANTNIRRVFAERMAKEHPDVSLRIPAFEFTTDNALMIGVAGFYHALRKDFTAPDDLTADGNLSLA